MAHNSRFMNGWVTHWRTFLKAALGIGLGFGIGLGLVSLPIWLGWPAAAQAQTTEDSYPSATAAPAVPASSTAGESLFSASCTACHANGGNIIRRGKSLKQKALVRNGYGDVAAIASIITQGKGIMPAYADRLSAEEIEAIAQYVHSQAKTGW